MSWAYILLLGCLVFFNIGYGTSIYESKHILSEHKSSLLVNIAGLSFGLGLDCFLIGIIFFFFEI